MSDTNLDFTLAEYKEMHNGIAMLKSFVNEQSVIQTEIEVLTPLTQNSQRKRYLKNTGVPSLQMKILVRRNENCKLQSDNRKAQKADTKPEVLETIDSYQATWIKKRDDKKRDYLKS